MYVRPQNLEQACEWVIVNNVSISGKFPKRFYDATNGKSGKALTSAVEKIILDGNTLKCQSACVKKYHGWWTIEDVIVHYHRTPWLSDDRAKKQARKNHECYQRLRKGLPC